LRLWRLPVPRVESERVVRTHIFLYERDVRRLHALYDDRIGYSKAIRVIVRRFLNQLDMHSKQSVLNIQIEDDEIILGELSDE
jgi:hypothetical protein